MAEVQQRREIGYEAIVDPLQMIPDGLDDPYMLLLAFSRLSQAKDSRGGRRGRWLFGTILDGAIARLQAAAVFALTGINPRAPKVVRGADGRALAAESGRAPDWSRRRA
jgi:hypothetical protein